MAKFYLAQSKALPAFFDISANVGDKSPNNVEDVALVTFLMRCAASSQHLENEMKPDFMNIQIGVAGPQLTATIRKWEQLRGYPVEGHVSTCHGRANFTTRNGPRAFLLALLNYDTATAYPGVFPRIDQIQGCPPAVTTLVKRTFLSA